MKIAAYTSVCQKDARWVPQYLSEAARLEMPFAVHFDRCSSELKRLMVQHPLFLGCTWRDDPAVGFRETHKQDVLDLLVYNDADLDWVLAWDIDETWERDARPKIEQLMRLDATDVDVRWLQLWDDERHVRVDSPFNEGHRTSFHRLQPGVRLKFLSDLVNGPTRVDDAGRKLPWKQVRFDLTCLHWGMMTEELRVAHKRRWDDIYSKVGGNPSGFWDLCLDPTKIPRLEEHGLLP